MKIVKNYMYNVLYQLFVLVIPLVTVPYVSRVLGSAGIGINAYTNSIVQYFILFGSIGINLYGNRTIAYHRDNKIIRSSIFWEINFLRFICIVTSYFLFIIFLLSTNTYSEYYFYQSFLIIAAALDISWYFMGIEDFKKTIIRNLLVKIISLVAIFLFVRKSSDLGKYILILSLSTLGGNLTLWPYMRSQVFKPNFRDLNIKKHLRPSLSLFIPQIATQIYLVLNKTMLGLIQNVKDAGFYDNTDKMVKIVLAVVTATGTVMLPRVAHTFAVGDHQKVKEYLYTFFDFVNCLSIPLAFGLAAIAPKFSFWFFGSQFDIIGQLLPILSIVIIFIGWSNVLGVQYLLPTNQTKYYTISVVSGAIINLILNFPLIYFFGIYGAMSSTVVSELAVSCVQMYFVKNEMSISKLFNGSWKYFLSAFLMFLIVRFLNNNLPARLIYFILEILLGAVLYSGGIILTRSPFITKVTLYFKSK